MITETFICDKCNEEAPIGDADFATLQVTIAWGNRNALPPGYNVPARSAQWCRKCINLLGIIKPVEIKNVFDDTVRVKQPHEVLTELLQDLGFVTDDQVSETIRQSR